MICVIHGYIEGGDAESSNASVLAALPEHGALLIRPMFGLLPYSRGHAYYGHLIHFAVEYKECYIFDEEWLTALEGLLNQLSWKSATATLQWSEETRIWSANPDNTIRGKVALAGHADRPKAAW